MIQPQPIEFLEKTHRAPVTVIQPLTPEASTYLTEVRKLALETLDAFGVGCTAKGSIAIPFFDEHGERRLVKFRHPQGELLKWTVDGSEHEAKTIAEKQGKGVLLGSNLAHPSAGALVICFGDYDAMSLYQAGVLNTVSLPFGDGGWDFVKYQWEWLETFPEIILCPDNDSHLPLEKQQKSKDKLRGLAQRLGLHRCKLAILPQGIKDANELLIQQGETACVRVIDDADWMPEEGLIKIADHVENASKEGRSTGFLELDRFTGGFGDGDLVVVGGDNGTGKTTFALNVMVHYVDNRVPTFIWSGEQTVTKIRNWVERIAAGHSNLDSHTAVSTGFTYYYPKKEYTPIIRDWYRDYLFQYKNFHTSKESFFGVVEVAIRRYDIKLVVIDNLMAFTGGEGEGYYQAQGDFAQSCKMFAERWGVTVILIVHNKKPQVGLTKLVLATKDDVEGSKKITNWADTVLQMNRVPVQFQVDEFAGADGVLGLCKSRESGMMGSLPIKVDGSSNRVCFVGQSFDIKRYGWER